MLPEIAPDTVVEVRGAALQMLAHARKFEDLRLQFYAGWSADDVETIEVIRGGRPVFYAERAGSEWEDRRKKRIRKNVDGYLAGLTHARVRAFIDEELLADPLRRSAPKSKTSVVLRNLQGEELKLQWWQSQGRLLGQSNQRGDALFELYPETVRLLERGP